MKPHVTRDGIRDGLRGLGLKSGDAVGVHSSLSSFGRVEGGPDAVIDALLDVIGPEGTLVFPTYSDNRELVAVTPEEQARGVTLKIRMLPYDAATAGCWTGAIPAAFLRRPGITRGHSPAHSLAAIGRHQAMFAERRWDALWELDGVIVMMGVGLGCCSAMHLAERQLVELPERILARMRPPADLVARNPDLTLCYGPYPDFARMEEPCRAAGILREATIGAATVKLLRLRALVDAYAQALRENPDRFYAGGY